VQRAAIVAMPQLNELSGIVLRCAIRVHTTLGPGLFERVYLPCLAYELREAGLKVEVEKILPATYRGVRFDLAFRLDLLVEDSLIVEVKALDALLPAHTAQMINYLKLSGCRLGLILNFGAPKLTDGIRRVVNDPAVERHSADAVSD
jgi:GxxExxY protein